MTVEDKRFTTTRERSERVKQLLKLRGRSRYWLGQQLGWSPTRIYKLLDPPPSYRDPNPLMETWIRICEVLECQLGDIFDKDGDE